MHWIRIQIHVCPDPAGDDEQLKRKQLRTIFLIKCFRSEKNDFFYGIYEGL